MKQLYIVGKSSPPFNRATLGCVAKTFSPSDNLRRLEAFFHLPQGSIIFSSQPKKGAWAFPALNNQRVTLPMEVFLEETQSTVTVPVFCVKGLKALHVANSNNDKVSGGSSIEIYLNLAAVFSLHHGKVANADVVRMETGLKEIVKAELGKDFNGRIFVTIVPDPHNPYACINIYAHNSFWFKVENQKVIEEDIVA